MEICTGYGEDMKDDQGFTKKQKTELGEMFADLFKEVVLPSLEILSDRLDEIEKRLNGIETRLKSLEDKLDEVWADLKARVSVLERRVGIATL